MSFSPIKGIESEFSGARFGDARLDRRVELLAKALAVRPGASLPQALRDRAQLAAAYRFLSHDQVTLPRILDPHFGQSAARVKAAGVALALHDTTEFEFEGDREGLGRLSADTRRGFRLHCALAVSADGERRPLGVLAARTWVRAKKKRPRRNGRRLNGAECAKLGDRESMRWRETIDEAESRMGDVSRLIHVADREADAFELLAFLQGKRFVIRASHDRQIIDDDLQLVSEACVATEDILELEVPLSPSSTRKLPNAAKQYAPRAFRVARLAISARTVELRAPQHLRLGDDRVKVNMVHVRELDVPEGADPVHWVLYTSEPIATLAQILAVVEHYRTRWLIEEYFKALKTGCEFEKLQLETYDALVNALAIYLPIASTMLALRTTARSTPNAPATSVLSPTQLEVLRLFSPMKLKPEPTVEEVFVAVANLGGYRKHKIPPGWLTLGRGMYELLLLERAYRAGKQGALVGDH